MKARCPHGSPWFVECWPCADEVIVEHNRKVVNFREAYNDRLFRTGVGDGFYPTVEHSYYWPRGCGPVPPPPGVHEFDGVSFFSSAHEQPQVPFEMPEPQPLTIASFLRVRTDIWRRLFGRHLRSVK